MPSPVRSDPNEGQAATASRELSPTAWGRLLEARRKIQPVLIWSAVVGALAGAVGGIYRVALTAIAEGRAWLGGLPVPDAIGWLVPAATSGLLVATAVWLVRRFAPETAGSGVQEIEGALDGVRPLRWRRVIPVKMVGGLLSLGAGLVLGREGPTIQLGGAGGKMTAELLGEGEEQTHKLVAAGAGAGLAAAFSAPFAGILFVVEEMRPQFRYGVGSLQAVVIACAVADIVVQLVAGSRLAVPIPDVASPSMASLWLFPLLGCVYGLLGVAFNAGLLGSLDGIERLPGGPVAKALVLGGLVGALAWWAPTVTGDGHAILERCLAGALPLAALLGLLVVRFGTTLASYATGAPGGIFAPMLALGGLLGFAFGEIAHGLGAATPPLAFAVAGLGALFAATVRAPLTGMILAMELTGAFDQVLPLMLTCATATLVAHALGSPPIYTALLERALVREQASRDAAGGARPD